MISPGLDTARELGKQKRGAGVCQTPSAGPRLHNFSVTGAVPVLGHFDLPHPRPLPHETGQSHRSQCRWSCPAIARRRLHCAIDLSHKSLADRAHSYRHSAFTLASFCITHAPTITRTTGIARKECKIITTWNACVARKVLVRISAIHRP